MILKIHLASYQQLDLIDNAKMSFVLEVVLLVCLSLACTTQAAPQPVQVKGKVKSDLPLPELQLLTSVVSQALIQETNENEGMTKTYCKLVLSLLKSFGSKYDDNYCDDQIDDKTSFPEDNNQSTEDTYKLILGVLKNIYPAELNALSEEKHG